MAQRRMFNKSITNSSRFLKMPATCRLLYYDLGMNADDDGFVEHFMVLRITGATQQDLGVLEANGLVKIFDENVLWIKDWKENNYIRSDRYQPSKYISIYKLSTVGIPKVDIGKDRLELGKDSIDNISSKKHKFGNYKHVLLTDKELEKLKNDFTNYEELINYLDEYIEMKGYKAKNHNLAIRKWVVDAVNEYKLKHKRIEAKPEWFGKEIKIKKISVEEQKELEEMLKEYK